MARRVFLLGLDGGSWNVFDHLFARDVMPNFQRLCREGIRGPLESTIPPVTPVAWTSLMTGVNPGRHGVFAFRKVLPENSYLPLPINRLDMEVPTIFDYYRDDPSFVSVNLPMSFPATPLAGRMITGMMTPQNRTDRAAHPAGLLDDIRAAGIDYVIDPKLEESSGVDPENLIERWSEAPVDILERLGRITENRMRAVELLMRQRDWSVFIGVIVGTDRIQHLFFDDLMSGNDGPLTSAVHDYYRQLDRHLGWLMENLAAEDALLVVSDHGFTRTHGSFQVNEWLRQQGWLQKREARRSPLYPVKVLLNRLGITRSKLGKVLSPAQSSRLQLMASHIDWTGTKAFLSGPFAIRINLKGRETLGTVEPEDYCVLVEKIADGLKKLVDDEGCPLLARIDRGTDLYQGDAGGQPGDIVFTFRDDHNYTAYSADLGEPIFRPFAGKQGDHRIDGIVAAWGGGIKPSLDEHLLSICDILPTVMHLNGRAVPGICDGRVAETWLLDPRPVEIDHDWSAFRREAGPIVYSAEQEAEINERLRALGYLSDGDGNR